MHWKAFYLHRYLSFANARKETFLKCQPSCSNGYFFAFNEWYEKPWALQHSVREPHASHSSPLISTMMFWRFIQFLLISLWYNFVYAVAYLFPKLTPRRIGLCFKFSFGHIVHYAVKSCVCNYCSRFHNRIV